MNRPNKEGAREIYRIYLTNDLPYDGALAKEAGNIGAAIDRLVERILEGQFARREENKFLEITLRSGRKEMLYRSDLLSGAIIASIVERAKGLAIKRAIAIKERGFGACARRNQRKRFAAVVHRRVHGERYFSADRYDGGLVQADRLRSGKCGEDFAGAPR